MLLLTIWLFVLTFVLGDRQICYTIVGVTSCGYYKDALKLGNSLKEADRKVEIRKVDSTWDEWSAKLTELYNFMPNSQNHRSSPYIFMGCDPRDYRFIGGLDRFSRYLQKTHSK